MTRVNVGIAPADLCDQHLVAEYRELPRCLNYKPQSLVGEFRLGVGHVVWCAFYPGSLLARHALLRDEMAYRGFTVNMVLPLPKPEDRKWSATDELRGRDLLQARIRDRFASMRKDPRWTNRFRPAWAA